MNRTLTFMIAGNEARALQELSQLLLVHKRCKLLLRNAEGGSLQAEVARLCPSALLIAVGEDLERELALIRQLAHDCHDTMLIAAGYEATPEMILKCLRAGAREFLRLPAQAEDFDDVLDRTAEISSQRAAQPRELGQVMALFSTKGGCGASFLAANLGLALSGQGLSTVLVDLNLQSGDLGFFFHLEPKFTMANFIENLTNMDDALLASLLTPYSRTLSLLPGPRDVDAALGIQAAQVRDAIDVLRRHFDWVVIDLGHLFDELTLAAIDASDLLLLTLTMDVMAIRGVQRALGVLDKLECPREKVRVVVNRWSRKTLNLTAPQIERFLSMRVAGLVPDDAALVSRSINLGHPLVEEHPSSPVSVELRRLARVFSHAAPDAEAERHAAPADGNGHAGANGHHAANGHGRSGVRFFDRFRFFRPSPDDGKRAPRG